MRQYRKRLERYQGSHSSSSPAVAVSSNVNVGFVDAEGVDVVEKSGAANVLAQDGAVYEVEKEGP